MLVAGVAWVVTAPYLVGLGVAHWRPLNRFVASNLTLATCVGWAAIFVLAGVVFAGGGGLTALVVAPFVGLAFWVHGPSDDDDGDPPPPEPDDPGPALVKRFAQPPRRSRDLHGIGDPERRRVSSGSPGA
jgi:hypothetical protein